MFAGHIGAGLALARGQRRVNVGIFVAAAALLDLLLWLFVLLGWESLTLSADFARTHQPEFYFPWSHSLLASLGWSVLAGAAAYCGFHRLGSKRLRTALLVAAAVFSHWPLDALVHSPGLPLAGAGSTVVGLGLWRALPAALAVEAIVALAGLGWFVAGSALPRGRTIALSVLSLLVLVFTVVGMTAAPPPPSALAMAATSLSTLGLVCGLAFWLGRPAPSAPPGSSNGR